MIKPMNARQRKANRLFNRARKIHAHGDTTHRRYKALLCALKMERWCF